MTTKNATTASKGKLSSPSIVKLQQLHPAPLPGLRRCNPIPVSSLPIMIPFRVLCLFALSDFVHAGCAIYNDDSIARVMQTSQNEAESDPCGA